MFLASKFEASASSRYIKAQWFDWKNHRYRSMYRRPSARDVYLARVTPHHWAILYYWRKCSRTKSEAKNMADFDVCWRHLHDDWSEMPTELLLTNRDPKYFTKPFPSRKYLYFAGLFTSYIEKKQENALVLLELSCFTGNWNILSQKTLYSLVRIYQNFFGGRNWLIYGENSTQMSIF